MQGFDFFHRIYVLNQEERTDRLQTFFNDLLIHGIDIRCEIFYAIPADVPMKSFCISQYGMLRQFLETDGKTLLALEDDCRFEDMGILWRAIDELPDNWDVLYLGCNLKGESPEPYSNHLSKVKTAWMSHAIGYSRKMVEFIVENYKPKEGQMYDDWLSHQLPSKNCFVINPMIAFQRPSFSDLWGCYTDYTSTIEEGNKLL